MPETADKKLTRMLDYWRSLCEDSRIPGRNAIDPLSIPQLLPYILLLDVEKNDFRFRLVGEAVNRRYGGQIKGQSLAELLDGQILAETLEEHVLCIDSHAAVYTRNTIHTIDTDDMKQYQRLILPLSDNGVEVQSIAGVMHFEK
ncbi:PAS domain-containing protein [Pelagibius sp. Alg239-R121]|uniref:PAS domain-containing protein n=1 Tax=Pelagibius sp. Alg239-R121 TaxID=2993448 RepID=UPI0024A6E666|nr:PAS domain-containing protein [Pelagibius sp. Alg239-R121]